jgi:hypothetical protein
MRPGQQNKRGRGRGGNNGGGGSRKGQNPLSRTYDSSGPDVKVRGTAQHVAEKYMNLARDAQSSGDRVMAENYLQHAEHYNRIIMTAQAQMQERFQRDENQPQNRDQQDQDDDDRDNAVEKDVSAQEQRAERSERQPRQDRPNRRDRSERPERQPRQTGQDAQEQQPAYDPDAPQPVIEGVPAEVAIGQESTNEEAAPAPRRRGRPRRVRADETAETSAPEKDKPAPVEPAAAD